MVDFVGVTVIKGEFGRLSGADGERYEPGYQKFSPFTVGTQVIVAGLKIAYQNLAVVVGTFTYNAVTNLRLACAAAVLNRFDEVGIPVDVVGFILSFGYQIESLFETDDIIFILLADVVSQVFLGLQLRPDINRFQVKSLIHNRNLGTVDGNGLSPDFHTEFG